MHLRIFRLVLNYIKYRLSEGKIDLRFISLSFTKVRGFAVTPTASPLVKLPTRLIFSKDTFALFEDSWLDFYDRNGRRLGNDCEVYMASFFDILRTELSTAKKVELLRAFTGSFTKSLANIELSRIVYISKPICSLIFKDLMLHELKLELRQERNLIRGQSIEFSSLSSYEEVGFVLGTFVQQFYVSNIYRIPLDSFFNKHIFQGTMFLCFTGTLAPIENEALFKQFMSLKVFTVIAITSESLCIQPITNG